MPPTDLCSSCGFIHALTERCGPFVPAKSLREAVWSAQHDATCDDGEPHPWSDHLPWDDPEDEQAAIAEADAIIHALDAARSTATPDRDALIEARHRFQRHDGPADHLACRRWAEEVMEVAALAGSGPEPNWSADVTGHCPCGGQCHHNGRPCSESCVDANKRAGSGPEARLREDAGYLADAAVHMADHMKSLDLYCEDANNVRHFAGKVREASPPPQPHRSRLPGRTTMPGRDALQRHSHGSGSFAPEWDAPPPVEPRATTETGRRLQALLTRQGNPLAAMDVVAVEREAVAALTATPTASPTDLPCTCEPFFSGHVVGHPDCPRGRMEAASPTATGPDLRGTPWAGAEGRSIREAASPTATVGSICGRAFCDRLECVHPTATGSITRGMVKGYGSRGL